MKLKEVYQMLKKIGLPVTYYQWQEGDPSNPVPELPYIVYYYPSNSDEQADGINYARINSLNIELYTKQKDFALEEQVERILTEHGFFFYKQETYLDDDHMFEVLYETEVVING